MSSKIEKLKSWIADLQKGTYVNCVYCGHRYGPNETTPVSMADVLKAHVEMCSEHPMSRLKMQLEIAVKELEACRNYGHRPQEIAEALFKIEELSKESNPI